MDILSWLWWAVSGLLAVLWSLAWFLLGGWVSTLAQIVVIVGVIFFYKYGWQRAPYEISARLSSFGRFFWSWLRQREPGTPAPRTDVHEVIRTVRVKEAGDVNISTLLTLLTLGGFWLLSLL